MLLTERYSREDGLWRSLESGSVIYDDLGPPDVWPDETNTGWEHTGVTLTPYTGTHFINVDTVIDSKVIDLEAIFVVGGAKLTLTRCEANVGFIDVSGLGSSLLMEDTRVNGGQLSNAIVAFGNIIMRRCDIRGGQHSVKCDSNGLIEYCWLHDQYNDPDIEDGYHNNAYISNGGNNVTLRYNRLDCSTVLTPWNNGGPTGDASIFGDFEPLSYFTFKGNLFMPTTGSYGLSAGWNPGKTYGETAHHIAIIDNVFEKGPSGHNGASGAVTSWNPDRPGNIWLNNLYDDGSVVVPT